MDAEVCNLNQNQSTVKKPTGEFKLKLRTSGVGGKRGEGLVVVVMVGGVVFRLRD